MKIFRLYLIQNNFQKLPKSAFGDSPQKERAGHWKKEK